MIFRDAIRSIKKDFAKAFFYWLTFVLTTMFIYLFYNISMSDPTVNPLNNSNNTITFVTVLVLVLCSVDILFANDFYVKMKGKDLAVRLICGGTFTQMASFLLIQTIILLVCAIPLGIGLSTLLIGPVNQLLAMTGGDAFVVTVIPSAMFQATFVIGYVIFWIVLLNLSFAYRNAVGLLMNPGTVVGDNVGDAFTVKAINKTVQKVFWGILFFLPIAIIFYNNGIALVASIIGLFALNFCVDSIVVPWINKRMQTKAVHDPLAMATLGFVRRDLKILKSNIFLFLISAIMLAAMMISNQESALIHMAILVAYVVMTLLQGLALMFKFSTEVSQRVRLFKTLDHIGYTTPERKKVIGKEVRFVYGFIFVVSTLYIGSVLVSNLIGGTLDSTIAMIMFAGYILPIILCAIINHVLYVRTVMPKANPNATSEEDHID